MCRPSGVKSGAGSRFGGAQWPRAEMVELVRTNNPVLLSWLLAELASRDIAGVVLDVQTSIVEGSISAIPRRLMVASDDLARARAVLVAADALGTAGEGTRR